MNEYGELFGICVMVIVKEGVVSMQFAGGKVLASFESGMDADKTDFTLDCVPVVFSGDGPIYRDQEHLFAGQPIVLKIPKN